MAIQESKTSTHWNYFLALERDLDTLSRYVEFDQRNFGCFSLEIARILMSAGAEVDVVCKLLGKAANPDSKADSINDYRKEIKTAFPEIPIFEVLVDRYGLTLNPWEKWGGKSGVPVWWTANNKIKHHRDSQYPQASLKNALNAVAALFVIVLYLYRDKAEAGKLNPTPQLLTVGARHEGGFVIGGDPVYRLLAS